MKTAYERGDSESKSLIEKFVPHMMKLLKEKEEWDYLKISLLMSEESLLLVAKEEDILKDSAT